MIEGIKLINQQTIKKPNICINTGTIKKKFSFTGKRGRSCSFNGYIPKEDWREIASEEIKLLLDFNKSMNFNNYIRLSFLPSEIIAKCLYFFQNSLSYSLAIRTLLSKKYIGEIQNYIYDNFLLKEVPKYLGLRILSNLNLPTITYNEITNHYIGLHIDCWDDSNADTRNCRNRICVNLGTESRFFYFINLSIEQIKTFCLDNDTSNLSKRKMTLHFLNKETNYPVIRVTLNPGEYYVAPTERIIHDASFNGCEDITITILGYFK